MDGEELSSAIRNGKLEKVQELIGPIDFGSPTELLRGRNLLCDAIEAGQLDTIKLLLDKGASVNVQSNDGFTRDPPLIAAVRKRDTKIVQVLLDKGANIEAKSQWGATSLYDAITLGSIDMVKILLDNKANVYNPVFKYGSALDHAVKFEKRNIIDLLISRGARLGETPEYTGYNSNRDNLLCAAVQRGYVYLVECYLKQGSNVNSKYYIGQKKCYTPLHFACEGHKREIVKILIRYGADINAKAKGNKTPLHIAIKKRTEFVGTLLFCGADVDAEDIYERTPLYFAVINGDRQTVKMILKCGPDITKESNKRCLKIAVCEYMEDAGADIVGYLLSYGFTSKTVNVDEEMIQVAVIKGYIHFVDDFLKSSDITFTYTDISAYKGSTLLHTACEYKTIQTVKYLLRKGADIHARSSTGVTPLLVAVLREQGQIVELLLERGANINDQDYYGRTAIYFAAYLGSISIFRCLLKYCPRIDKLTENPLCAAVIGNRKERRTIIEDLLEYGFTVTPRDIYNCEFLPHAVRKGDLNIVKDLLKYIPKGEMLRYRDGKWRTPLHYAALTGQKKLVELLLERGSDVNAKECKGMTPMYFLIIRATQYIENENVKKDPIKVKEDQQTYLEILEILLQNGADPTIKEIRGLTVLHYAACSYTGMEEIAKLLLKGGVDVNLASEEGSTPLFITSSRGNRELAMLFLEHGALEFGNRSDKKTLKYVNEVIGETEYHEYFTIPLGRHLVDINSVDDRGSTALFFAYRHGFKKLMVYLLEYGADVNAGTQDWLNRIWTRFTKSAYIIKYHILKLSIAGLKVPVDTFLSQDYELIDSADGYRDELKKMKREKIPGTTVSYGDVLTDDKDQLAAYAENKSIVSSVNAPNCRQLFPLYSGVMKGFMWRGVVRKGLLEKGKEVFTGYCGELSDLPVVCVKKIFEYLTDQDLRVLIRSHEESP